MKWVVIFGSHFQLHDHELEPAQVGFCSKETELRRFFLTSEMTRGASVRESLEGGCVSASRVHFIPRLG